MICFGPQAGKTSVPFCWGLPDVSKVITKYQSLPKEEQDKKKLDNKSLLEQQIKKLQLELKLRVDENQKLEREPAYPLWDESLNCYSIEDLKCLGEYVVEKLRETYERIAQLTSQQQQQQLQRDDHCQNTLELSSSNAYLLQGDSFSGEYDCIRRLLSYSDDNIPSNLVSHAVSSLPFTPHTLPAVPDLQAHSTSVDFPVQPSHQLYDSIAISDLQADLSDLGERSQGGLSSDMRQMLTVCSDDQLQQLPQSTRKLLQLQNLQCGTSGELIFPTLTALGTSSPSTSCKKLEFNPLVLNDWNMWPADSPVVSQASELQIELGDGSEALDLQLQARLDETRSLNQQQSADNFNN